MFCYFLCMVMFKFVKQNMLWTTVVPFSLKIAHIMHSSTTQFSLYIRLEKSAKNLWYRKSSEVHNASWHFSVQTRAFAIPAAMSGWADLNDIDNNAPPVKRNVEDDALWTPDPVEESSSSSESDSEDEQGRDRSRSVDINWQKWEVLYGKVKYQIRIRSLVVQ